MRKGALVAAAVGMIALTSGCTSAQGAEVGLTRRSDGTLVVTTAWCVDQTAHTFTITERRAGVGQVDSKVGAVSSTAAIPSGVPATSAPTTSEAPTTSAASATTPPAALRASGPSSGKLTVVALASPPPGWTVAGPGLRPGATYIYVAGSSERRASLFSPGSAHAGMLAFRLEDLPVDDAPMPSAMWIVPGRVTNRDGLEDAAYRLTTCRH